MYKKSVQGWLKHLDFMILDVVCLWISFTLAFNMRHGSLDVLANSLYRYDVEPRTHGYRGNLFL